MCYSNLSMESYYSGFTNLDISVFLPDRIETNTIVYVHCMKEEGENIFSLLNKKVPLIVISGNDWEKDFSPFKHSKVFHGGHDFQGGADDYLEVLTKKIIPTIEKKIPFLIQKRIIAGYSLAGLLAFYSIYKTDLFDSVACVSGSLWYPGMMEYIKKEEPIRIPNKIYFSLGDKESETKNPFLSKAYDCMKETADLFNIKGSKTFFELNKGGHFIDSDKRTAKAISWLLS